MTTIELVPRFIKIFNFGIESTKFLFRDFKSSFDCCFSYFDLLKALKCFGLLVNTISFSLLVLYTALAFSDLLMKEIGFGSVKILLTLNWKKTNKIIKKYKYQVLIFSCHSSAVPAM